MKKVSISSIKINNFKGISKGEFSFNGNTEIVADVKQSKTTIKEAYYFCLGIEIDKFYPINKDNKYIDNLDTKVEVTLKVNDLEYVLSRSAKLKYKTNKETQEKEFDGFKKDMFEFDNVPCTTAEYKNKLIGLFDISDYETLKYLLILDYFNKQEWKQRRELIYNLYADKNEIDKLKDNEKYDLISNELKKGKHSSDISTMLNSENNKIVAEKRKNEILLAEKQNELSTFANIDYDNIEKELHEIEEKIVKEEEKLANTNINSKKAELVKQISEKKLQETNLEIEFNANKNKLLNELAILENNVSNLKNKGINIENEISLKTKEYKETKSLEYDNTKEMCPTCHQRLPQAQIDTIIQDFENYKADKLKSLTSEIKALKVQYDNYKEKYTNAISLLENKKSSISELKESEELIGLKEEIKQLENDLSNTKDIEIDNSIINNLRDKKYELTKELGNKTAQNNCKERITSLLKDQINIANSEILLAKKVEQLETYILDIISIVNDSINSHFDGVKFKLFENLTATAKKDIKETLVVLNDGVDYVACSTGQKAETDMIIISTLQKTFNIELPIWIDDASITNFDKLPTNQMIFLYNQKGAKLNCTRIRDIY